MRKRISVLGMIGVISMATEAMGAPTPVVISAGVADPLPGEGTGLCSATATSAEPAVDFALVSPSLFLETTNRYIDDHAATRVENVLRTPFDLSNNNAAGLKLSYGDFVDANLPECKTGGCDFTVNDSVTAFGARLRGYLNVTADLANQPIHFGLYADDAVGLVIFDKNMTEHEVIVRPAEIGFPVWRVTNQVTFQTPGLYPIEVIYLQITEHAALEMSYFVGDFADFERPVYQPPAVNLADAGFTLFKPTSFFQTLTGEPSNADLGTCQQCKREFANQAGNSGCAAGSYCNDAAICARCASNTFCGATCAPCGGNTPYCGLVEQAYQCVGCRTDNDCSNGSTCDAISKFCTSSSSSSSSSGGDPNEPPDDGCACSAVGGSSGAGLSAIFGIGIAVMGMRRARRRASTTNTGRVNTR